MKDVIAITDTLMPIVIVVYGVSTKLSLERQAI